MEGVITQGMTVAFTRHFENMKQMETFYWYYKNHPEADFVFPADQAGGKDMTYMPALDKNKKMNNILNILNYPITNEANYFQQEYC